MKQLSGFVRAYLETALWSSTDESDERGGDPLDKNYTVEDFAPEAIARAEADCAKFQSENEDALCSADVTCGPDFDRFERGGHDFWLTRNGHGCGFWDGDWSEPQGSQLTDASKAFGSCEAILGDDGQIHLEGS